MSCAEICPREQSKRDPDSPGVVSSDEDIHRAFFPSDRNTFGIKPSAITAKHLWAGQLSVWRACELVGVNVDQLVGLIDPMIVRNGGAERIDQLRAAPVRLIREHRVDGVGERSFSVLDDCVFDEGGSKHPAHAHIAICSRLQQEISYKDDTFNALQEGLKLIFEHGRKVWCR